MRKKKETSILPRAGRSCCSSFLARKASKSSRFPCAGFLRLTADEFRGRFRVLELAKQPPPFHIKEYQMLKTATTEMIPPSRVTREKTPTIFFSLHPHISKWWWMGLILKMRLPVVWKLMTCKTTDSASIT